MEPGTLQEDVLSPTLFNILINFIAKVKTPGVFKTIYADDITFQEWDDRHLQLAFNKFTKICNSTCIVISSSKTKVLTSKKHPLNPFKIQGTVLITESNFKYL